MKNFIYTLLIGIVLIVSSCKQNLGTETPIGPNDVRVTGIAITPASDVSVPIGATTSLGVNITPDNATNKAVTWQSQHTAIATVNASGEVLGVVEGTATISATAQDGSGVTTTKSVKVVAPTGPITSGNVGPRPNTYDDPANAIYVATNGNDATANGSIDKPYKSINAALAAGGAGSTIVLRGGTYREGGEVRPRNKNVTIKSRKGEWAIIDLSNQTEANKWDSGIYLDPDASGFTLRCVEVIGGFYAFATETTWDWGVEYYPTKYGVSNVLIEDCKLHDSQVDVIKIKPNCNHITIRYNEIYNSGRSITGAQATNGEGNAEGIDNVNGDNMHVHNNYIHHIVGTGIYAKGGAADALIENNLLENINAAGIMVGFDTNLEWMEDGSEGPGFDYFENIRSIVRNNLIIKAGWEGIGLYASKDAQVYNNTVVDAVCGVLQYHSGLWFGTASQDGQTGFGHPANVNPKIHHNIICMWPNSNNSMIEIRYSNEYGGMSGLNGKPTMNDNCYYIAGKSATFTDNRPGSTLSKAGLAAWKTHISGDTGSIEVNPALDAKYMPANPQCTGMGIQVVLTK